MRQLRVIGHEDLLLLGDGRKAVVEAHAKQKINKWMIFVFHHAVNGVGGDVRLDGMFKGVFLLSIVVMFRNRISY